MMKKLSIYIICALALFSCEETVIDVYETEDLTDLEINSSSSEQTGGLVYPDFFPEYNWDYLNVCIHTDSQTGFTDEQALFLSRFPIICLEKSHWKTTYGYSDIGTKLGAEQLKKLNPDLKMLAYFSFNTDYGTFHSTGGLLYEPEELNPSGNIYYDDTQTAYVIANDRVHPEYAAISTASDGSVSYQYSSTNYRLLDHTYPEAREFLYNKMTSWMADCEYIDGVFIDSYGASVKGDQTDDRDEGVIAMRDMIYEGISSRAIVLGNCISASNSTDESSVEEIFEKLETTSGGMMEHFCIIGGAPKENIAACIELIQRIGKAGKMIVAKGWPRYNITMSLSHLSTEYLEECAREDIVFPLACFLCGAQKYAYFCYSWAYTYSTGAHIDYDEYNKKLGEPLGDYIRDGYVFTREFEYASVWVDVENKEANIIWHEDLI